MMRAEVLRPDTCSDMAITNFLLNEARLLDQGDLQSWLKLFTDDAIYWIPGTHGQTDPLTVPSIVYEDRPLLAMRVRRLQHPRAHAATPMPRTVHLISNIQIAEGNEDPSIFRVLSNFMVVEFRDDEKRIFAGHCEHLLKHTGDDFRIALKRLDLIDCDGIHEFITLPL